MRPFRIAIPQRDLDDLHDRLARTRWPRQLPAAPHDGATTGDGWQRGVPVDHLRDLAEHWRTGYDWRAHERRLNDFPQYATEIDGQDIHFLHVRSPHPDALPLILTHGWPNSIVEFTDLIGRMTESFHVVAPSVPGYGFSAPPRQAGWTIGRVAGIWAALMDRLGYQRYGAHGGDLGAYVTTDLAREAPDRVVGVHLTGGLGFPTEADVPGMSEAERADYAEMQQWASGGVDHHALLRAAPQTFGYGWHDSPAALLAWHLHKFAEFNVTGKPLEQIIDRDLVLTNASVYWFTGTSASSSWPMYDSTDLGWPKGQKAVPSGVYGGGPALFRRLAERDNTIVHWPDTNPMSHHFVAMDQPDALAADLRTFFAKVR